MNAAWKWGLGAWAVLRLLATVAGMYALGAMDIGPTAEVPGYALPDEGPLGGAAGMWLRADALWYLRVAVEGYGGNPGAFAFYPAFPLLTRALLPLFAGNELYAGLLVANVSCALGFVACYSLFERLVGESGARAGVAGMALFPTSFFLVAPYAEPVLIAAGAAAVLMALRERPWAAFALGAVAALARPFGILLAVPLALIGGSRRWWAGMGPLAGAGAWVGWVAWRTGEPWAAVEVQSIWQREAAFPLATLVAGFRGWISFLGEDLGIYFLIDLGAAVLGIGLVIATAVLLRRHGAPRWGMWGLVFYGAAVLLVPLSAPFPPRPLLSLPRILLANFPGFVAFGLVGRRGRLPLALASAAALAAMTAAYVAARPIF